VTNIGDALLKETGEALAAELEAAGLDVLLDDRDERAGVKFKDATWWAFLTASTWARRREGLVELVKRATATSVDVKLNEAWRW